MSNGRAPTPAGTSPAWVVGAITIIAFIALLYVVEAWDALHGQSARADGIRPWTVDGLWGILWAPLLHANWEHLNGNAGPRWCSVF